MAVPWAFGSLHYFSLLSSRSQMRWQITPAITEIKMNSNISCNEFTSLLVKVEEGVAQLKHYIISKTIYLMILIYSSSLLL